MCSRFCETLLWVTKNFSEFLQVLNNEPWRCFLIGYLAKRRVRQGVVRKYSVRNWVFLVSKYWYLYIVAISMLWEWRMRMESFGMSIVELHATCTIVSHILGPLLIGDLENAVVFFLIYLFIFLGFSWVWVPWFGLDWVFAPVGACMHLLLFHLLPVHSRPCPYHSLFVFLWFPSSPLSASLQVDSLSPFHSSCSLAARAPIIPGSNVHSR